MEPWGRKTQNNEVRIIDDGVTLTIGSAPSGPTLHMHYTGGTQVGADDTQAMLLGALCHVLVQQLPISARVEALQNLLEIREFHKEAPSATPRQLLSTTAQARVTQTRTRPVPPLGQE